jgi:hypothetical protein
MERRFVKGTSVDENIDSIDLILQHWEGRLGNWITGIIPPIPILHHCKTPGEDGTVFAGLLPCGGKVTDAYLSIGSFKQRPITILISINSPSGDVRGVKLDVDKVFVRWQQEVLVVAGSIIRVEILPVDGARDFLIGILLHPEMEQTTKEHRMLKELKQLEVQNALDSSGSFFTGC